MTNQKNVTEEGNTSKEIEVTLQLSPEQYEIYELLAKLNGQDDLISYIHSCMNFVVKGEIDSIEDPKERERITALFGEESSALTMDQTVVFHGFYDASPSQLKAVVEAAKVLGYSSPSEFLQSTIKGGACSDMDHLAVFEGASEMEAILKEA